MPPCSAGSNGTPACGRSCFAKPTASHNTPQCSKAAGQCSEGTTWQRTGHTELAARRDCQCAAICIQLKLNPHYSSLSNSPTSWCFSIEHHLRNVQNVMQSPAHNSRRTTVFCSPSSPCHRLCCYCCFCHCCFCHCCSCCCLLTESFQLACQHVNILSSCLCMTPSLLSMQLCSASTKTPASAQRECLQ